MRLVAALSVKKRSSRQRSRTGVQSVLTCWNAFDHSVAKFSWVARVKVRVANPLGFKSKAGVFGYEGCQCRLDGISNAQRVRIESREVGLQFGRGKLLPHLSVGGRQAD